MREREKERRGEYENRDGKEKSLKNRCAKIVCLHSVTVTSTNNSKIKFVLEFLFLLGKLNFIRSCGTTILSNSEFTRDSEGKS